MGVPLSHMPSFAYNQLCVTVPYPTKSFEGRTVIVTGGNIGLGLETARHIVRLGAAKVIISSRDTEKGEAAKQSIEASEKRPGSVEVWALDLCSYDSVRAFAARARALPRLDALICNAGIATFKFQLAEGGHESTITTNVISTFLLSLLLLPKLKQTAVATNAPAHLTIVSSDVHAFTAFPERCAPAGQLFAALSDPHKARMNDRYKVSKLLEVLAVRELAAPAPAPAPAADDDDKKKTKTSSDPAVVITAANPGFCYSALRRDVAAMGLLPRLAVATFERCFARSSEQGARNFVLAASAGPDWHGAYVSEGRVAAPGAVVTGVEGEELQRRVWGELRAVLEGIEPGVTGGV